MLGLLALGSVSAVAAPEEDAESAYLRGRRLESVLGDLEGALEAYRSAGRSRNAERRAVAGIREAAVLRALGKSDDARAVLQRLLTDPELPDPHRRRSEARDALERLDRPETTTDEVSPEVEALREAKKNAEREVYALRRQLDEALETSADVQQLRGRLTELETERKDILARLRTAERSARGVRGDLTEEEREELRRENERASRMLSSEWTRYGRELYLAGRFEDSRRFLRDAVDLDASNVAARDLLAKASAPFGEGEQIVKGILEVLALEQELRAEQVRAEVARWVEDGRRLLSEDSPTDAMEAFERALNHMDLEPGLRDRLDGVRDQTAALFDEAARRAGSDRRAPEAPEESPGDPRWREAIRSVLEQAGSSGEAGGAALRVLPLGSIQRAQRAILPPAPIAGVPPMGFVLAAEPPAAGDLIAAALRASVRPDAWEAPGAVLQSVGATLLARAGPEALKGVEQTLATLALAPKRSLVFHVVVVPCSPETLVQSLARHGATLERGPTGSSAVAILGPGTAEPLLQSLGGRDASVASAKVRVAARRGFTMEALSLGSTTAAADETPGVRVDALAWVRGDGTLAAGFAVNVAAEAVPGASSSLGGAVLARQRVVHGASLSPGGAVVLGGFTHPLRRNKDEAAHCAILIEVGTSTEAVTAGAGRVLPLLDLPGRSPDLPGPLSASPRDLRGARTEILRQWLESRAPAGVTVTRRGAGLRVDAPEAAIALVERDLERLRAVRESTPCEVLAWTLRAGDEADLLKGMPLDSPAPETELRIARLRGRDRVEARFLLEGTGRKMSLGGKGPVPVAPAQRVAFSRTEGTAAAGSRRMAGMETGLRMWPGDLPGERWLWIDVSWRRTDDREPEREPVIRVPLKGETGLLIVGLPNPFADAAEHPRLVLWVEIAPK